jgi:hypothetical protein
MVGRLDILTLLLTLSAASWSCSATIMPESSPTELSEESCESSCLGDLIGVWRGGSICRWSRVGTSCRGAVNIAFTLFPAVRSRMTGFYSCTTVTVRCRNQLENGSIGSIEINGKRLWLRVMLGDGSSCLFTSRFGRSRMAGGYECLQGAGLVEQVSRGSSGLTRSAGPARALPRKDACSVVVFGGVGINDTDEPSTRRDRHSRSR